MISLGSVNGLDWVKVRELVIEIKFQGHTSNLFPHNSYQAEELNPIQNQINKVDSIKSKKTPNIVTLTIYFLN